MLKLELITNAYQATLMIKVPIEGSYEEQYKSIMEIKKKVFPLIILLNYVFAAIYLIIEHGSLPIDKCFPYIIFYTFGVFGLYQYESYKTLCITQGKPKILLLGSTIGSCVRVIICYLFYNTSIALFIFGIVNFLDFYIRSVIYRIELSKIKEQNL